jgi:hypothetical protein
MRSFRLPALALVSASVQSTHAFAVVNHPLAAAYQQVTALYRTNKKSTRAGVVTHLEAIGGLTEAWDTYNAALKTDPLIVKSVTAFVILGAADFAGQALEKVRSGTDKDVDFPRAARFAFFGLVLQAPWNHFYYMLLDGQIPPTEEPFSNTNVVKVCIDQFIQAPVFTVLIFAFLGALEGKGLEDIKKQLKDDYPETIVANCEFCWIVVGMPPKPFS